MPRTGLYQNQFCLATIVVSGLREVTHTSEKCYHEAKKSPNQAFSHTPKTPPDPIRIPEVQFWHLSVERLLLEISSSLSAETLHTLPDNV